MIIGKYVFCKEHPSVLLIVIVRVKCGLTAQFDRTSRW